MKLELYYDFVCPYAYLASLVAADVAASAGAELERIPILLGGVFRAIGGPDVPMRNVPEAKAAYMRRDLQRAAASFGVELAGPADHPRRTVLALRAAIASGSLEIASRALFHAYWREGRDLEQPDVVRAALDAAGLDGARALSGANAQSVKDTLRANTERAVADGVFGVPGFVVVSGERRELFWGVDRLRFVREALGAKASEPTSKSTTTRPRAGDFYFDYSSPFAYLASTQIDGIATRTGADIRWKPILLGGLFRDIGTPDVPLFQMPEAKRKHVMLDLSRWASAYEVPFRFPSRFPMNTVKALRLTILCPEAKKRELVRALFDALWVDDRDLSNDADLRAIGESVGVDVRALEPSLGDASTKAMLRTATDEAKARGVFGVPTIAIGSELYWGQDRLELVERELAQ